MGKGRQAKKQVVKKTTMEKVRSAIQQYEMVEPGQHILVAVSGGADSTTLLHALKALREELDISLTVVHYNHRLRGAEAEAEAAHVAALCNRFDIPLIAGSGDVAGRKRRLHLSTQEAARQLRHQFLRETASKIGADRIALGHTRDDLVETMLLNMVRGSGLEGLTGFLPVRMPIIRPLYDVSRVETAAYCQEYGLTPCEDSSNQKLDYRRNRVRTELLPYLTTYFNESASENLLRLSQLVADDSHILEEITKESLSQILVVQNANRIVLDSVSFLSLPTGLKRRVLRAAIRDLRGDLNQIGFESIERFVQAAPDEKLSAILPERENVSVRVEWCISSLIIECLPVPVTPLSWSTPLSVPGRTMVPVGSVTIVAEEFASNQNIRLSPNEQNNTLKQAIFAREGITYPLTARSWQPGDRMRPVGLGGSRKVQDILTDLKVPRFERHLVPVITETGNGGRILLLGHYRVDENVLMPDSSALLGKRLFIRIESNPQ